MDLDEDELDLAFAHKIEASPEFTTWVLGQTKFVEFKSRVRLLHEEQADLRPRKYWWKDWWCKIPELAQERQTDIFIVFETIDSKRRFALYIENKKSDGAFEPGQAESYSYMAKHIMKKEKKLNYTDFATILISPYSFRKYNRAKCDLFDCWIAYEDIAKFIPEFGS